jgi:hypothetical protein
LFTEIKICEKLKTSKGTTPQDKNQKRKNKMKNENQIEAKAQIKSILEGKFLKLIKNGMSPEDAITDVLGAFEQEFPGLLEKLA